MENDFNFLVYQTAEENVSVNALVKDETIWLTQKAMAELFDVDKSSISRHLKNIFNEGELDEKVVVAKIATNIVDVVALPKLVRFAQDDDFDSSDVTDYLKSEFAPYNLNDYSELVLGCTHFNYFKDSFSKLFPDDLEMVDGNTGVSNNLKNTVVKKGIFKEEDKGKKGTVEYYYSDRKMESEAEMKHIKKLHERLERMRQI